MQNHPVPPHSDQQARHVDLRNSEHHEKKFAKNLAMCGYYATQLFAQKQHLFDNFVTNSVAVVKDCDKSSLFYAYCVVFRQLCGYFATTSAPVSADLTTFDATTRSDLCVNPNKCQVAATAILTIC